MSDPQPDYKPVQVHVANIEDDLRASNALVEAHRAQTIVAASQNTSVAASAVAAREQALVAAAYLTAKANPRDENVAFARVQQSFGRPRCAENAIYAFPRGGTKVTGPSVDLARECARCWGNIKFGVRIVEETTERVHIQAYAIDLESGIAVDVEDKFSKLHQRKQKDGSSRWIKIEDERDLRELVNRRGAICLRNAILQVVPSWLIDEALETAATTVRNGVANNAGSRADQIRRLVSGFSHLGVNSDMLVDYLDHPVEEINQAEAQELRGIYRSIADGNSQVGEHFTSQKRPAQGQAPAPAPAPATAPPPPPPPKQPEPKAEEPVAKQPRKKASPPPEPQPAAQPEPPAQPAQPAQSAQEAKPEPEPQHPTTKEKDPASQPPWEGNGDAPQVNMSDESEEQVRNDLLSAIIDYQAKDRTKFNRVAGALLQRHGVPAVSRLSTDGLRELNRELNLAIG